MKKISLFLLVFVIALPLVLVISKISELLAIVLAYSIFVILVANAVTCLLDKAEEAASVSVPENEFVAPEEQEREFICPKGGNCEGCVCDKPCACGHDHKKNDQ